jgi:hypothetical protein
MEMESSGATTSTHMGITYAHDERPVNLDRATLQCPTSTHGAGRIIGRGLPPHNDWLTLVMCTVEDCTHKMWFVCNKCKYSHKNAHFLTKKHISNHRQRNHKDTAKSRTRKRKQPTTDVPTAPQADMPELAMGESSPPVASHPLPVGPEEQSIGLQDDEDDDSPVEISLRQQLDELLEDDPSQAWPDLGHDDEDPPPDLHPNEPTAAHHSLEWSHAGPVPWVHGNLETLNFSDEANKTFFRESHLSNVSHAGMEYLVLQAARSQTHRPPGLQGAAPSQAPCCSAHENSQTGPALHQE